MSEPNTDSPTPRMSLAFWLELRLLCRRALQVWKMVPCADKWSFGGVSFVMALTSGCAVFIPLAIGRLVDEVGEGIKQGATATQMYWIAGVILAVIAALVLLREILNVCRRFLVENTCTRIDKEMSVKTVSHLLTVDLGSLTHEKIGSLNGRIFRNVDGFMRFLRAAFLDFFPAVTTGLLALVAAFCKVPWIGLVMALAVPASVVLTACQLLSQKDIRLQLIKNREELDGNLVELLGGLDYVRVADTHDLEVKRFTRSCEERRRVELKHHTAMVFFGSGKALLEGFFHLVVLGSAVYLAINGYTSFGSILTFSGLFLNVMTPIAEVHRILDEGHEASLRVGDLMDMLDRPVDESYRTETARGPRRDDVGPIIATQNLKVTYTSAHGQKVTALHDVNLEVRPGETVGVVGRSGCGKSTLIKVLMRVTHACEGQAYLQGIPLAYVSREMISTLIGYVGQSPFIFSGTVEQNILYGSKHGVPAEDVRKAARRACIHDEIVAMPDGYHSILAEHGANLSGGQKQRIALARIFLKDPPILILDEATSALDNISERKVQEAIEAAREERTLILVAHRLSTLCDADRILVFDGGRLMEEGSYHTLLEKGGIFTGLVRSAQRNNGAAVDAAAAQAMA